MPARVRFKGVEATCENYAWRSTSLAVARELAEATLDVDGPSGADPDPDATAAQLAAELLGAEIIDLGPHPLTVVGRVY